MDSMTGDLFEKVDDLTRNDEVHIHFSDDESAEVSGIELENPWETTVESVMERRLDEKKGHDVDGIVTVKEIYLTPPEHDDLHGEYVIEMERPMIGENKVRSIEAREYFEGSPGDSQYAIHLVGFTDIELV